MHRSHRWKRSRLLQVRRLPALLLSAMLASNVKAGAQAESFLVADASARYDFLLRFTDDACDGMPIAPDYGSCEGPGIVEVRSKGQTQPLQVLELENLFVSFSGSALSGSAAPRVNAAQRYERQGAINVGDFNFDGHEDFAVQNGNQGSYGGPSYEVYLYSPAASRFVANAQMTGLVAETLGFFEVDAKAKRLKTAAKSGCCYHEYVEYAVLDGTPVAVHRLIEDAMGVGEDGRMTVTEETLVKGRWRRKSRRVDLDAYYGP